MIDPRRWRMGLVPLVVAIGLPWFASAQNADDSGDDDEVRLAQLEQDFSVPVGETLSLSYQVNGDLPAGALATTATTTTTTTPPPGTADQDADDGAPDSPGTGPDTTPTTVPDVSTEARVLVYPRITDASEVTDVLSGGSEALDNADDGLDVPLDGGLQVTGRGNDRRVTMDVEVAVADQITDATDNIGMPDPGIYPVETLLRLDGETVARHMTLVRREPADAGSSLNLAVLAGVFDSDAPEDELGELTRLAELDVPVTAAVPPVLLAETADRTEGVVEELADALRDDEMVALPDDGLDPSSAAHADLDDEFTGRLRSGEDMLGQLVTDTPVRRSVWPVVAGLPSTEGADLLAQLGVRTFVVNPVLGNGDTTADEHPHEGSRRVPLPNGDIDAVVVDPEVAALLDGPADRSPREAAIELLAHLTIQQGDTGDRLGSLLTTADIGVPDPAVVDAVAALTDDTDDVTFTSASALSTRAPADTADVLELPASAGVDLQPRVEAVNLTWLELTDTVSMLPEDDERRTRWRDELDALLSTEITNEEARRVTEGLQNESDALRDAVVAPDPFTFTMTGRRSDVRVRITNDADTPLTVRVSGNSPKFTFPDGAQTVELEPGATTLVTVEVGARSNGTSELVLMIRTPNGERLTEPVHLTATVRSLTGISQLVTGGAALVLLTWWITHLRRRWLERRLTLETARHPSALGVRRASSPSNDR